MNVSADSVRERIEGMICKRARIASTEHDNLTAYYYGQGLEGQKKDRNFRAFFHFFSDVEREFGVIFPISVWDRNWKISNFSIYVDKLINQPWRSLSEGQKRLKREAEPIFSVLYAICTLIAAALLLLGYLSPIGSLTREAFIPGMLLAILVFYLGQKKLRRIWRIKQLIRVNENRKRDQKPGKQSLDMIS